MFKFGLSAHLHCIEAISLTSSIEKSLENSVDKSNPDMLTERTNSPDFSSIASERPLTINPKADSLKFERSTTASADIEEVLIDDLSLLNCSKYLRIREIIVYSDDLVSGVTLRYRLPTGQIIECKHSLDYD